MKRTLFLKSLVLLVCLMLPGIGWAYDSFTQGNIKYIINDGLCMVSGVANGATEIVIPQTVSRSGKTYTVTRIKEKAFNGNTTLEKVIYPTTLNNIGNEAFYNCTALHTFQRSGLSTANKVCSIQSNITYVGSSAFWGCTSLESVVFMGVQTGYYLFGIFGQCGATTATVYGNVPEQLFIESKKLERCYIYTYTDTPDKKVIVGEDAFSSCSSLTNIGLTNVWKVKSHAFSRTGLKSVTIYAGITLEEYAFSTCTDMTTATISCEDISNYCFTNCSSLANVTINSGVKTIGLQAFNGCKSLKCDLLLPNTIEKIGYGAFQMSPLSSFNIPSSVTSIGKYAFSTGAYLESMTVDNTRCMDGTFRFREMGIYGVKNLQFGSSITQIPARAFEGNGLIEGVTIGSSVEVGDMAFHNCLALNFANLSCKRLGEGAFSNCNSMNTLTLSADEVGYGAFMGCSSLKKTTISAFPSKAEKMHPCFQGCTGELYITASTIASEGGEKNNLFIGSGFTQATIDTYKLYLIRNCGTLKKVVFNNPTYVRANVVDGCPSVSEFDITGDAGSFLVEDGCIYDQTSQGYRLQAAPAAKEQIVLKKGTYAVYYLDLFKGLIDATQLTSVPSTFSINRNITQFPTVVVPANLMLDFRAHPVWSRLGDHIIAQTIKGDINYDGKVDTDDVTYMQDQILKK